MCGLLSELSSSSCNGLQPSDEEGFFFTFFFWFFSQFRTKVTVLSSKLSKVRNRFEMILKRDIFVIQKKFKNYPEIVKNGQKNPKKNLKNSL